MARRRAIGLRREALVAAHHAPDRPSQALGSQRDQRGAGRDGPFGPKPATHKGAQHTHVRNVHIELASQFAAKSINRLRRFVDGELGTVPDRCGREQFDGIVGLCRSTVFGLDTHGRTLVGRREIPGLRILLEAVRIPRRRQFLGARRIQIGRRLLRHILSRHTGSPLFSGLKGLRHHHGYDLAVMPDLAFVQRAQ